MDEDKVIADNKFLEKVVADIKKGEKTRRRKRRKKTRKRNIKANASGVAMYDSKKTSSNSNIKKGLQYAEKLVGIKYQAIIKLQPKIHVHFGIEMVLSPPIARR